MDLVHLIITIVLGGIVYALAQSLIKLPPQFKTAVYYASCIWLIYVILTAFGVWPNGVVVR